MLLQKSDDICLVLILQDAVLLEKEEQIGEVKLCFLRLSEEYFKSEKKKWNSRP